MSSSDFLHIFIALIKIFILPISKVGQPSYKTLKIIKNLTTEKLENFSRPFLRIIYGNYSSVWIAENYINDTTARYYWSFFISFKNDRQFWRLWSSILMYDSLTDDHSSNHYSTKSIDRGRLRAMMKNWARTHKLELKQSVFNLLSFW